MSKKSEIVTDPTEKDGIVLSKETMDKIYGGKGTAENMPEANKLASEIVEIMEYITTEPMLELRKNDYAKFRSMTADQFPYFEIRYHGIFESILEGEVDIENLIYLIKIVDQVKNKEINLDDAESQVANEFKERMVYSKMSRKMARKMRRYDERQRKKKTN